jgi:hypothetical protein
LEQLGKEAGENQVQVMRLGQKYRGLNKDID